MKPYPAYKDSGIEWIGEVPEHWEISKAKYHSKIVLGKMLTPNDKGNYQLKSYLKAKNILWEKVDVSEVEEMWFSENEMNQYRLQLKDLVVSEGGEVGRTAIWMNELEECYIQNSVHKVTVNMPHNPRYFLFQFVSHGKRGYFDSIVSRVSIAHLTREKLKEVTVFVPSPEEQQSISIFLDHKTSQIDNLIDKKQKQIELLKEERTSIINQAVTKGLNPDVPMKDSGIEWLGEVPEHWEIRKLKYLADQTREKKETYGSLKIGLENIESWTGRLINLELENVFESEGIAFNQGAILFGKLRPYLAKVHKAQEAGICVSEILVLRPNKIVTSDFLYYRCLSDDFIKEVNSSTYGSKMPRANWDFIGNLSIPFPTISEQNSITSLIVSSIHKSNRLIESIQQQITILQEYRTALISNAVTGKIDVRREEGMQ